MFPTADKTWAAATAHFQQYANNRDEELTTETAGFQRANHAQTNSNTGTLGDITSQLANLAARDESRNTEFRALQAELAANKAEYAVTKAMLTAYKDGHKASGNNGGGSNKNRRRNNGGGDDNTSNNNNNEPTALPTTVRSPYSLYVPTSDVPTTTAIIDSGATSNYCHFDSTTTPCFDVKPTKNPIVVRLPDNRTITSTHEGYLRLPHLSKEARKTHLFHNMQAPLISVGQLCDSGCIATFDQDKVVVMFDNHVVLTGHQDYTTGMWQVQLPTNSATNPLHATADLPGPNILEHAAHTAVAAESMPERIAFLHACVGSPAIRLSAQPLTLDITQHGQT